LVSTYEEIEKTSISVRGDIIAFSEECRAEDLAKVLAHYLTDGQISFSLASHCGEAITTSLLDGLDRIHCGVTTSTAYWLDLDTLMVLLHTSSNSEKMLFRCAA
jgi:hypothetical protein